MTEKRIPTVSAPESLTMTQSMEAPFIAVPNGDVLDVCLQYWQQQKVHAVDTCYMRRPVYDRLVQAQQYLPAGYRLRVWDAWRPLALQEELHEEYSRYLMDRFDLHHRSEEERERVIRQFVSYPHSDRMAAPVHTTGGAVDVTLIDADGNEVDMGTAFDEFTEKARTDFYEAEGADEGVRRHRRMLYHCMTRAGFTNLPSEWWHYDYGDMFWAYYTDATGVYPGAFTDEEVYGE